MDTTKMYRKRTTPQSNITQYFEKEKELKTKEVIINGEKLVKVI